MNLRRKILIIEDNEWNRALLAEILSSEYDTLEAENGKAGLEILEKEKEEISLILLDIRMPVMDGYEATRRIRSLNRLDAKTIPIVAMTANAFAEDVEESRSAGMNEHISKPLDIGKVKLTIARYIGRKRS